MRAIIVSMAAAIGVCSPTAAQEKPDEKMPHPHVLTEPANTEACLKTMEVVLQRALDADLVDEQATVAEEHLDKLETACLAGRFTDALDEAKAIEKILAVSK